MIARSSYSEPLRSHMRRKFWADLRTVSCACLAAVVIFAAGITLGHTILKTALILTLPPQIPGCC